METEVEAKFLNVDIEEIRKKLAAAGAMLEHPMRLMRRVIIEPPTLSARDAFIRVRDEGNKVTVTYKQFDDHTAFSGARELEVEVSDFDKMVAIFEQGDLVSKSYQESRRETWRLGSVEVVIDEWPWLNPYIEIEGRSEEDVQVAAKRLGFRWNNAVFGSVTVAYQAQYPAGDASKLVTVERVTFTDTLPSIISGQKEK